MSIRLDGHMEVERNAFKNLKRSCAICQPKTLQKIKISLGSVKAKPELSPHLPN